MIVEIFVLVIFWINALSPSPSVGGYLIPHHIVTGLTVNYNTH